MYNACAPHSLGSASGSVAQSVEQRIENPRVGGSIPSRATIFVSTALRQRGVAQPGRAPALGAGCRRFESCRPDKKALFRVPFFLIELSSWVKRKVGSSAKCVETPIFASWRSATALYEHTQPIVLKVAISISSPLYQFHLAVKAAVAQRVGVRVEWEEDRIGRGKDTGDGEVEGLVVDAVQGDAVRGVVGVAAKIPLSPTYRGEGCEVSDKPRRLTWTLTWSWLLPRQRLRRP